MAGSHPHLRPPLPGLPGQHLLAGRDPLWCELGLPGHEEEGRGPGVPGAVYEVPAPSRRAVCRALHGGFDAHDVTYMSLHYITLHYMT